MLTLEEWHQVIGVDFLTIQEVGDDGQNLEFVSHTLRCQFVNKEVHRIANQIETHIFIPLNLFVLASNSKTTLEVLQIWRLKIQTIAIKNLRYTSISVKWLSNARQYSRQVMLELHINESLDQAALRSLAFL